MTRICGNFTRAPVSLKNLHFHWFLFHVWPKKVQMSYLSWQWRVMGNFNKTLLRFAKWHEKYENFHQSTGKCQNWGFCSNGILLPKVENVWVKIYRGVMCHRNEGWYKNWRGIDLPFQNWHEKFDEFWLEPSKI